MEITTSELQNETASVLSRVEAGETITITVGGRPVADLVPHQTDGPRWMPRDELIELLKTHSADPGLRDDLDRIAGDTSDNLGPIL